MLIVIDLVKEPMKEWKPLWDLTKRIAVDCYKTAFPPRDPSDRLYDDYVYFHANLISTYRTDTLFKQGDRVIFFKNTWYSGELEEFELRFSPGDYRGEGLLRFAAKKPNVKDRPEFIFNVKYEKKPRSEKMLVNVTVY